MSEGTGPGGRPWWASGDAAREGAEGSDGAAARERWQHGDGEICQICPLCALLRVVDEARPEVVEHLVEAARHLSLAAKAVVDSYVAGMPEGDEGLERIDLEDE